MADVDRRRAGSVLLFVIAIMTVMVIVAFAFVRVMQMSRGTMAVQRRDDLARLAAEMGMQHAVAVLLHDYAMPTEVRDGGAAAPVSHIDRLGRKAFDQLSPISTTSATLHPPRDYDLAPDVPFNDLFANWGSSYHASIAWILGYSYGWSQTRSYARIFEANRFVFDRNAVYDASTYDRYRPDQSLPTAAVPAPAANATSALVATPFPPVDPFVRGYAVDSGDRLDNPLFLDADCRPVADAAAARYRLRYAVTTHDMSAALWMNTDMPWLSAARRQQVRDGYKDGIEAVGTALALVDTGYGGSITTNYSPTLENVFLGHGAYASSLFTAGVPTEWPERGGGAMGYRSPTSSSRVFYNLHGASSRPWNEAAGWLGSAIPSFNDLGFAVAKENQQWHTNSEAEPDGANSSMRAVREDQFAQRVGTPFGRPVGAATDQPWAVNALAVPARVLAAMVSAYVPPAARAMLATSEIHWPYKDGSFLSTGTTTWNLPLSSAGTVDGMGIDLFTTTFEPETGFTPFAYAAPADRDYWYAAASARRNHTAVVDARANADRYPGAAFFSRSAVEGAKANRLTRWLSTASEPRQVEDDPNDLANAVSPAIGADHLGRHIIFYKPDGGGTAAAPGGYAKYLSGFYRPQVPYNPASPTAATFPGRRYVMADEFNPITPFGRDSLPADTEKVDTPASAAGEYNPYGFGWVGSMGIYLPTTNVVYTPPSPENFTGTYPDLTSLTGGGTYTEPDVVGTSPGARGGLSTWPGTTKVSMWQVRRSTGKFCNPVAPNSYWQRLSTAFFHAVAVAQTANLAWADGQDARSQSLWIDSTTAGIMYNATPDDNAAGVRKGSLARKHASDPKGTDSWDPAAAHFRTLEQLDRQFLANLGESFDHPGRRTPGQALAEAGGDGALRPPRWMRWNRRKANDDPSPGSFAVAHCLSVGEYRVSNNIRTLLTPIDAAAGATLTASSTDAQTGVNAPPRKLWLLDEWNADADGAYAPGTTVDTHPTLLARLRAQQMERVLNDWRLSFLGSASAYAGGFRPKDFDGDGQVFCSGYSGGAASAATGGLGCYAAADGDGNGPGTAGGLRLFSLTGCLTIDRTRQVRIQVRGELYDNFTSRAVSEQYLESALLIDPDGDVVRASGASSLPTGLGDSQIIFQRPVHNYYQGYLNRSYP